jgi:hypothetical protein
MAMMGHREGSEGSSSGGDTMKLCLMGTNAGVHRLVCAMVAATREGELLEAAGGGSGGGAGADGGGGGADAATGGASSSSSSSPSSKARGKKQSALSKSPSSSPRRAPQQQQEEQQEQQCPEPGGVGDVAWCLAASAVQLYIVPSGSNDLAHYLASEDQWYQRQVCTHMAAPGRLDTRGKHVVRCLT